MNNSRFVIGIDLGTTNIAVAYCDTARGDGSVRLFPVPQLVAPGEVRAEKLYPSACWLPDENFCPPALLALPWQAESRLATGQLARNEGALQPSRYIASAKSWLCHAGVDRRKKILPWLPGGAGGVMSPLEVTTLYLKHLRDAWNREFGGQRDGDGEMCRLETQQTVITVPASFDETARALTLEAAGAAGLRQVALLEEPLAAFYAWLHHRRDDWREKLAPGSHILVVDIGGGTTDFSLIGYGVDGILSRTAAGEHLLLGGDNIDIALARKIETDWGIHLAQEQWLTLCALTRSAKEQLLSCSGRDEVAVTLLSRGSSVIGGVRKAVVGRKALEELLENGFFPALPVDALSPQRKSGIQTMGLPYAADPAVTRHLLDFLRRATGDIHQVTPLRPDLILYNGGSLLPESLRQRLTGIVSAWFPDRPPIPELPAADLDLAVAFGAAAAALAGRGQGTKVKCGTARSYYIETAGPDGSGVGICVMPHGIDEHVEIECGRKFLLEANRSAGFPLYSSAIRTADRSGDTVDLNDDLTPVSRLTGVLRFGNREHRRLETTLTCRLTETGLLQLEIRSLTTSHRWPLHFDTRIKPERKTATAPEVNPVGVVVSRDRLNDAAAVLRDAFEGNGKPAAAVTGQLEEMLTLPRAQWPLPLLRQLADELLTFDRDGFKQPETEARWLNLTGYCLRPGFGDPADELRRQRLWKSWGRGPVYSRNPQNAAEYWVFWRRLASGLTAGQQRTVFQHLAGLLTVKGEYQTKGGSVQERAEMWRCLGSLELSAPDQKIRVGKILLSRGAKLTDAELWTLGRLGARRLFHAPGNHVIPAATALEWSEKLMKSASPGRFQLLALYLLAAVAGDRGVDLAPAARQQVSAFLTRHQAPESWLESMEKVGTATADQAQFLGDTLPLGLSLVE